ncbi:MAG TPA: Ig-like domain-containing protein [Thermoanaerobaculia bacterium]|jgi:uncharacterized protein YjdB
MCLRRITALFLLASLALVASDCSRRPASIDISPKKVKIYGIERSQRVSARVLDKKGQPIEGTPRWGSSNDGIVAAEPGGRLIARKAGKTMITVSYEGLSAQVPVEVVDVSSIEIAPPSFSLIGPPGTSVPLAGTVKDSKQKSVDIKPTWTTANAKVATVSEEGVVTSVAPGSTTILAKVGDIQGACDVAVVVRPIARLEIRPVTAIGRVGDSQHFEVIAYGPDGIPIPDVAAAFHSSNPSVATVDTSGVATGRKAGTATIRVELAGQSAEATLLVN